MCTESRALEDALQLVHLYAERGSPKYERAAMRWLERYLTESSPRLRPGGTIRAAGTISGVQTTGTLHVVGGSGNYAKARGTVSMRNLNASGSRGLNVYRLQLP